LGRRSLDWGLAVLGIRLGQEIGACLSISLIHKFLTIEPIGTTHE
jgi:hypothetical protein